MSDLIDRQAALKAIFQKPAYHNCDGSYYHSDDIRKAVESIEASGGCEKCNDHSEPKRETGHWTFNPELYPGGDIKGHYECDQCGAWVREKANYCPDCGAKMLEIQPECKRGRWIQFPNHDAYKCSECGRVIETTDGKNNVCKHYPYCHCGCKMEVEHEQKT